MPVPEQESPRTVSLLQQGPSTANRRQCRLLTPLPDFGKQVESRLAYAGGLEVRAGEFFNIARL